jgi:hypothetical protein
MSIKGYPDQNKHSDGKPQYATVGPVREQQQALDVIAHQFHQVIGADAAEAASTTRVIVATAHAALVGDVISFTSGNLDTKEYRVSETSANAITTSEKMSEAPAAADTFNILRAKYPVVNDSGQLSIAATIDATKDAGNVDADTLRVVIASDNVPLSVDDGGSSLTVDGTVAATQSGTWNVGTVTTVSGVTTVSTLTTVTNPIGTTATGSNQAKGKVAGSALTGTYATVLTPGFIARLLALFNSCNDTILVSLDGGTTDGLELEAGESLTLDLGANGRHLASGVNIQAKHAGAAPTAGTLRITAVG